MNLFATLILTLATIHAQAQVPPKKDECGTLLKSHPSDSLKTKKIAASTKATVAKAETKEEVFKEPINLYNNSNSSLLGTYTETRIVTAPGKHATTQEFILEVRMAGSQVIIQTITKGSESMKTFTLDTLLSGLKNKREDLVSQIGKAELEKPIDEKAKKQSYTKVENGQTVVGFDFLDKNGVPDKFEGKRRSYRQILMLEQMLANPNIAKRPVVALKGSVYSTTDLFRQATSSYLANNLRKNPVINLTEKDRTRKGLDWMNSNTNTNYLIERFRLQKGL